MKRDYDRARKVRALQADIDKRKQSIALHRDMIARRKLEVKSLRKQS